MIDGSRACLLSPADRPSESLPTAGRSYLGLTTLLVRDYDEAVVFYVDAVGFELREDVAQADGTRWVVVYPRGARETGLLARAVNPRQAERIGDQTGGIEPI